jgi:hypothetical protein
VEDESGSLQASVTDIVNRAKRRHLLDKVHNVRLGMVRHCLVLLKNCVWGWVGSVVGDV